jgi:hypothetical protein
MTTELETSSYYQESDFLEYSFFFEKNDLDITITITKFVDSLNYVISEKEKPCDMFSFIFKMYKISKSHCGTIIKFLKNVDTLFNDDLVNTNYNTIGIYFFCKFLLLNVEKKHYIHTRINKLLQLSKLVDTPNYYEIVRDYSMDEFLEEAFLLSEDEVLCDFMICYDASNQYKRLDIDNIENISYQINNYCIDSYINKFIEGIVKYYFLKFFINFNECLAHTTTPLLNDEFNSFQHFKRMFKINRIMYMRLYNYLRGGYKYFSESQLNGDISDEQFCYIFNSIPNDVSIIFDGCDDEQKIQPNSDVYIGRCIQRYFIYTYGVMHRQKDSDNRYSNNYINLFIKKQLKYETLHSNDILYKYKYGLKNMNEMLNTRYKDYFKSELYKSLSTISLVTLKVYTTWKSTQDIIYYELEKYLKNILEQNYYSPFIYDLYK